VGTILATLVLAAPAQAQTVHRTDVSGPVVMRSIP
jgi:hypothetical protein